MRRFFLLGSLLVTVAFQAAPAHAGSQDFVLANQTGSQIDSVYVSESANQNWGPDIMGQDALPNGQTVNIQFNAPDNACSWDLKVKYNDGKEATWQNVNFCNINKVTLFWDRQNNTTRATAE